MKKATNKQKNIAKTNHDQKEFTDYVKELIKHDPELRREAIKYHRAKNLSKEEQKDVEERLGITL